MPLFMCLTCGMQYPESNEPPANCAICDDERQYVGWDGQQWTTLDALRADYQNDIRTEERNLTGIGTTPAFSINQRALLIQSPGGNILWDCLPLLTDAAVEAVNKLGGLSALAISHPHYYSTMIEWSHAFGRVPIYLHTAEKQWVMRPDPVVHFWDGETKALHDDITLIRCGGHYEGSQALHWPAGADGRGVLLTGDTIFVASDRRYVTFMYSFPNYIPLSPGAVQRVVDAVAPYNYDRLYSAWWGKVVQSDAKRAVELSAERYIRALRGELTPARK